MPNQLSVVHDPVTIAGGAALSDAISVRDRTLYNVELPAAWTAAALTIQVSKDDAATTGATVDAASWRDLTDADTGAAVSLPAAAGITLQLNMAQFFGHTWVRLRSGTAATPINQAASRVLYVSHRAHS